MYMLWFAKCNTNNKVDLRPLNCLFLFLCGIISFRQITEFCWRNIHMGLWLASQPYLITPFHGSDIKHIGLCYGIYSHQTLIQTY